MRVLLITTLFTVLASLFVAARLWTRFRIVKSPGYDDLLVLFALLSSITFYAFILVERQHGLGKHRQQLPEDVIQDQMHYLWLSVPFYNLSLILAKLSALVLYIRIFHNRSFLICTYITMGFLIITGLWMVISGFFFCVPVHYFWSANHQARESHCLSEGPVWYSNAAMQIVTDIVILILPMPLLSKLQLPRRQKVGVMLVFGLGIIVIATSSARLYELSVMVKGHDFTRTNAEAAIWSSLEADVSIICACLPPLHPLFSRIFSFCFRPQPLHSSPASKTPSTTTHLTSSRKPSTFDPHRPDGGIFYNDFLFVGPSYTASISKLRTEDEEANRQGADEDGIRVVKELRMVSDTAAAATSPKIAPHDTQDREFEMEMGLRRGSATASGTGNTGIEWDLGDFEFPDYKERMNSPIGMNNE
ncbi:uncharacterized protein N7482_009798 [Penicillium canariense]|uniref:Rhodopsin domain-containing protein n=1 Tax=Penicillium canariense TaxID=189055 RepID=A0A9W9LGM7_9EURO|nr:uncharacterized protein N7482_009798 [Penicillium canariense]KAJ5153320.1 hypothetical protein N7482_009798 [Penicillium canariense]